MLGKGTHQSENPTKTTTPRPTFWGKPFSWQKAKDRSLYWKMQEAIHNARCNKTYQLKYPQEHKSNPECKILTECHPDAKIRLLQEHKRYLQQTEMPAVERPKRLNRI